MKNRSRTPALVLASFLLTALLSGCRTATPPDVQVTALQDAAYTQAAQTVIAQLTLNAPPPTATQPPPPPPTATVVPPTATTAPTLPPPSPTDTPAPTNPPASTDTPAPTPVPTLMTGNTDDYKVVYEDGFSNQGVWPVQNSEQMNLSFGSGGYRIRNIVVNDVIWSVKTNSYSDVRLEVDASKLDGPSESYYGLICRFLDRSNFYGMGISSNGHALIIKKLDGKLEVLAQTENPSPAINVGSTPNRLVGECVGDTLRLYVNGVKLVEAQDGDLVAGYVGLMAGNFNKTGVWALFDNLVVKTPQ